MVRIKLADGTVLEENVKAVEIDTKLGTLFAEPKTANDYPGFYVSLRRPDGHEFNPMLVEVDQDEGWGDEPEMKMHYWSPESHFNDPVWNVSLTAAKIDSTWKE